MTVDDLDVANPSTAIPDNFLSDLRQPHPDDGAHRGGLPAGHNPWGTRSGTVAARLKASRHVGGVTPSGGFP